MSVLIKGMTMPASCGWCPCLSDTGCCEVASVKPGDCTILIEETQNGYEIVGRLPNCPLVEVNGRWVATHNYDPYTEDGYDMYSCSICGVEVDEKTEVCPKCGATMKGEI